MSGEANSMVTAEPIMATSLRVNVATDFEQLRELAVRWDALAGEIPFRSFEWAHTWWQHYSEPSSQLFTLVVSDEDGEIVGIAPWYLKGSPSLGRVVRFLGSGEVCSDYLTILVSSELAEAVVERLARWLAHEGATRWNLLELKGVEAENEVIAHLGQELAKQGLLVHREPDMNCWRTELSATWDDFLATLSKARRARTRTLLRRTVEAGRAVVHEVTTPEELAIAFEILIDLHQKRRRSLSQPGCFASTRFTDFHREMTQRLLARGQLRMLWTEFEGRPIAAEYGFAGGDVVFYYLGGFEPELADENPGWLALGSSLKLAIEQGFRVYDFLRGDESYKASWRAVARPLVHVRIVGKQPSARVRFATWRAYREIKGWARQVLSRAKR